MKKVVVFLSVLLVFTILLSACSKPQGADVPDQSAAPGTDEANQEDVPEKVTLRYMTWESGDWQTFSEDFIAKYEADHPNVTIQYEPTGEEYMTKLKTALSAGTAPDIAWVDQWVELFPTGVFEPLDSYIEKYDFEIEAQNPELIQMATYNGNLYGLFGWAGVTAIYYNKAMFDEAGVAYPEKGWTWDDVKEKARALTKGEGADKQYGISLPLDWNGAYETIMWGNGARFIDDNLNYDGVLNSDKMVEALTWYTSFVKEGLSPESSSLKALGGAEEMFKNNKVAMIYGFSGFVKTIRESDSFDINNLGVIHLPVGEKGQKPAVNPYFTNPICITATSQNKDEAFKFLAARVGVETQKEFCANGWTVPANNDLIEELGLMDDPYLAPFADALVNRDNYVYPKPSFCYSPISTIINDNMLDAISKVVLEDMDPKQALDEAVQNIKAAEQQ